MKFGLFFFGQEQFFFFKVAVNYFFTLAPVIMLSNYRNFHLGKVAI